MVETEKRQTYGEYVMTCLDRYLNARKEFERSVNLLGYIKGSPSEKELFKTREECRIAIDEIIREFHCPYC